VWSTELTKPRSVTRSGPTRRRWHAQDDVNGERNIASQIAFGVSDRRAERTVNATPPPAPRGEDSPATGQERAPESGMSHDRPSCAGFEMPAARNRPGPAGAASSSAGSPVPGQVNGRAPLVPPTGRAGSAISRQGERH